MLNARPAYFETIQRKAAQRWNQLEQDPELAGPWHQLFKQVQSPRHIVSELLQNADDAGATDAQVRIEDGAFIFEHNGEDFAEEHFASLCRFGYSNKRALHTIGFRGIGFKSTFSLGNQVELYSPSLAVTFDRRRFTEPKWAPGGLRDDGRTCVRVQISDENRRREVEKNLEEWLKSSLSPLFFKHIRRMQVGQRSVHWGSLGPGPVSNSEWVALHENEDEAFLIVRSEEEAFPEEALTEIKQERLLADDEAADFPPCKVDIVLGGRGRLYVVLPTMVETALPFATNAPFIQDPARLKIKDPETSPTNRWLLERAGRLAASAMGAWLNQKGIPAVERAGAYGLLPDVDRDDNSLQGVCGTIVEEEFGRQIEDLDILLSEEGSLVRAEGCIVIPEPVIDVWPAEQVAALIDTERRPPFSRHVSEDDRRKLLHWGLLEELDKDAFLAVLRRKHLPRPKTWRHLLGLWAYVAPEITGYWHRDQAQQVRIIPVQGKDVLYAAKEVVRLGEKKVLQSDSDWDFLSAYLIVLNQNWTRFLAEQRREAESKKDDNLQEAIESALAVLEETGLDNTSDASKVIDQVAAEFFAKDDIMLAECVQLAQIAARLGAKAGESFRFATRDAVLRSINEEILFDENGRIEELLPEELTERQILHSDYASHFSSCTSEEWKRWIFSAQSGLLTFPSLTQKRLNIFGRNRIEREVRMRGYDGHLSFPYVTNQFVLDDWDFAAECWEHWEEIGNSDPSIWQRIAEGILAERDAYWTRARSARAAQVATTGNTRAVTLGPLLPKWALRLRELACLPNTRGVQRKPGDLLRRTPETESLLDVEPFVHKLLDRESTQPLLDLLGIRSTPTGPDGLMERIRALAKAEEPPVHEIQKWYRRLDQMIDGCSTSDFHKIKQAFGSEKLILTADNTWESAKGVFLSTDEEDVPGALTVHPSVANLTLWRKVEVADRPTADLVIQWLRELPSGQTLTQEDARRVRALIVRHPTRVWSECGHWINLAGEWAPVAALEYALTMQTLVPWQHLHEWVKQRTANFRNLSGEMLSVEPFATLPSLASRVEDRFHRNLQFSAQAEAKEWLTTIGTELRRVELHVETETSRVRSLATTLAATRWQAAPGLEIIPYIDGTPAGTPRRADVVWLGQTLYVDELSPAKLARRVPEEVGRAFARADVKAALDYGFERPTAHVRAYIEENFSLAAPDQMIAPDNAEASATADANEHDEAQGGTDRSDHLATDAAAAGADEELAFDANQEDTVAAGDSQEDEATAQTKATQPRPRPIIRPARATIIERFAKAQGFRKESDERFFRDDGSWIARANGARFPWERWSSAGEFERYYLPKDHCLEREPLQLEADIWGLIDQMPDSYALVLADAEGEPVEVTGAQLRDMCERGEVKLYPATYRIVYEHDRHP